MNLKDPLRKFSQQELERFLEELEKNPIFKELRCLAEKRAEGIEIQVLSGYVEPEKVGSHNFDVGFRKGLSCIGGAVKLTKELIQEKERENA
jgi:hypothetical protein